jgi:hypothetical protein
MRRFLFFRHKSMKPFNIYKISRSFFGARGANINSGRIPSSTSRISNSVILSPVRVCPSPRGLEPTWNSIPSLTGRISNSVLNIWSNPSLPDSKTRRLAAFGLPESKKLGRDNQHYILTLASTCSGQVASNGGGTMTHFGPLVAVDSE